MTSCERTQADPASVGSALFWAIRPTDFVGAILWQGTQWHLPGIREKETIEWEISTTLSLDFAHLGRVIARI